ncbi:MAG: tetratricopeptide repeat protein [Candidatus Coatesbacteria bacterium]|nr:tetratricopeptide repeat protein [Candidatus Coatesbacteria bacterium]
MNKKSHVLLLFVVLLFTSYSGCAYYNTLYNAEKYYNKGIKLQEASKDTIASGEEIGYYDECVKKCIKVIYFYPKSKRVEDALYLMGLAYYQMGKRNPIGFGEISYKRGRTKFQELIKIYPNSKYKADAELYIGTLNYLVENYDDAKKVYKQMLEKVKEPKYRDQVYWGLGRVHNKIAEYDSTISLLKEYKTSNKENAKNIYFILGEAYLNSKRYDEAIKFFQSTIDSKAHREERYIAYLQIGNCYIELKEFEKARTAFENASKTTLDDKSRAQALLQLAEVHFKLKKRQEGADILEEVSSVYPKTLYSARSYLYLGKHYIEEDDYDKAQKALDQVRNEMPGSEEAILALYIYNRVNLLLKYKKLQNEGNLESRAKSMFQLAEISVFFFEKIDAGINHYDEMVKKHPNSPFAPRALFAIGWIYKYKKGDKAKSDEYYKQLIAKYPENLLRKLAEYDMKSEKGYEEFYNKAENEFYNYETAKKAQKYEEALKSLEKVEKEYPFDNLREKALFAKGLLYKNYLMDYKNARDTFKHLQKQAGYDSFYYELCKNEIKIIDDIEEAKKKQDSEKNKEKKESKEDKPEKDTSKDLKKTDDKNLEINKDKIKEKDIEEKK